ncbi:RIB43A-domain-containing protein [Tribonema minus]|uniref:RIB43A-domain-containing protein n=1 Tax=Tribonema minus TaxID=303371 RepID=A0A836CCQ6_9STRA|nr:RIB43A-domain-containing protein [Tribonema minus]
MIASLGSVPLTLEKELARSDAHRNRNEARVKKFLDARQRLIGVDKQALEDQIREKEAARQREREGAMLEFQRQERIRVLVEAQEAEERAARKAETDGVKSEWQAQTRSNQSRRAAEKEFYSAPIPVDACGPSSLQKFKGEDAQRAERVRAQRAQMKAWSEQQAAEAARAAAGRAGADAAYHEYLTQITDARQRMEEDEAAARAALRAETRAFNEALAREGAVRAAAWSALQARENAAELAHRDEELREGRGHVAGAQGHGHVRVDAFRGLSDQQREAVLRDNERLRAEAAGRAAAAAQQEAAWAAHDERVRETVDRVEAERAAEARAVTAHWRADIEQQQAVRAHKALQERIDRFGGIDPSSGFCGGFGKSCR